MNPTLATTADRAALRLSDTATVTVAVEGVAPLRVEVPADLLAGASADIWSIKPSGPARVTTLPDGRERWVQEYACAPFQPGKGLPLEFHPFRVKAGPAVEAVPLADRPLAFTVTTDLLGAKADDARPATGAEDVPPPPESAAGGPAAWAVSVAAGVMLVAAVVAAVRRRRFVPPVPPMREALAALDAPGDPPTADRVAEIVRRFLRRKGLPTETVTTAELMAEVRLRGDWPDERAAELEAILTAGDVAKFGGPETTPATENRERARRWVAELEG